MPASSQERVSSFVFSLHLRRASSSASRFCDPDRRVFRLSSMVGNLFAFLRQFPSRSRSEVLMRPRSVTMALTAEARRGVPAAGCIASQSRRGFQQLLGVASFCCTPASLLCVSRPPPRKFGSRAINAFAGCALGHNRHYPLAYSSSVVILMGCWDALVSFLRSGIYLIFWRVPGHDTGEHNALGGVLSSNPSDRLSKYRRVNVS